MIFCFIKLIEEILLNIISRKSQQLFPAGSNAHQLKGNRRTGSKEAMVEILVT
jgi:hypothetical protein